MSKSRFFNRLPSESRRKREARSERLLPLLFRFAAMVKWAGIACALMLIVAAGLLLYLRNQSLPVSVISQTSQMYDLHGRVIDSFHSGQNRHSVSLSEISGQLVKATLAIEDHRFYEHSGFDLLGMVRAAAVNLENLSKKQGASTLTQQLARNLYLSHERTWKRKLKEAVFTVQLEMNYAKNEILEMYLNQIYYGHGAYGIEMAARLYFNKPASELTLAESAMLAGVPKGPKYYSPYNNMKHAKDRQKLILQRMVDLDNITQAQADQAYDELLAFQPLGSVEREFAPYFRDYIHSVAVDVLGIEESLINEGGIRIYTTLDTDAQRAAEQAVADGLPTDSDLQAALVAIDPRTGYIKAMVGGRDYKQNQYNRVFAKTRQPGSSFKPLLYLTALQEGVLTPVSRFRSEPTVFTYDEGRHTYQPRNYNDKYANDEIDMRRAIASSDNIYAVSTAMAVGPEKVIELAHRLGIDSEMKPVPSLALGSFPVSPYEMASAFGALANEGKRVEPTAILRIETNRGQVLYEAKPATVQAVDAANAYVLTNLLESVFEAGGTGHRVSALIKRPVAGKTGTTSSDAWLVGYTPELSTAVWVGYDKGRTIVSAEAHRAAPIFAAFTEKALETVPPKIFPIPENVVSVYINPATGLLASDACPDKRLESFAAGTEPTVTCSGDTAESTGNTDVNNGSSHTETDKDGSRGASNETERHREQNRSWWQHLKRWWEN
ncbi:penicillin-binding protein [Paenibacillaceae bacterium]|nr:penicillin-binding protein [Paenibacillaceae bacterium]